MKVILLISKLFRFKILKFDDNTYGLVSKHSIKRIKDRMSYQSLLQIAVQKVLESGTRSAHFEYMKNGDTAYAKVYNGYIWVFDGNKLVTVYQISNTTDLLVIRK